MTENVNLPSDTPEGKAPWRDPLSIGWQAHRRLLLLRLRWHTSATRGRAARLLSAAQHSNR